MIKAGFKKKEVENEKKASSFKFLHKENCLPLFTGETIQRVVSNHAVEVSPAGSIDVVWYLVV